MTRYQVTCATREKGKHITHLGGIGWRTPVDRIKDELSIHLNVYYTLIDGQEVDLEVRHPNVGISLIQTTLDTTTAHYLDNLPDC